MAEYRVVINDRRGSLPTSVPDASSAVEAAALSIASNWDRTRTIDSISVSTGGVRATRLSNADQARATAAALASPELVRSGNNGMGGRRVDPASLTAQQASVRAALSARTPTQQAALDRVLGDSTTVAAQQRNAASASQSGTGNS